MKVADYFRMVRAGGIRLAFTHFINVHFFDLRNGVETATRVMPSAFGVPGGVDVDTVLYMASWTKTIERAYKWFSVNDSDALKNFCVLDVGCGKGKFLLVWYQLNLKNKISSPLIGVEFSPKFAIAARDNIEKMKARQGIISIVESDINSLKPQLGQKYIAYLYNPFGGETLTKFLNTWSPHIEYVIYCNPVNAGVLTSNGFSRVYKFQSWHANLNFQIFRNHDFSV